MKSIPRYTVGWKFFSSFRRVFSPTVVSENLAVSKSNQLDCFCHFWSPLFLSFAFCAE